MKYLTLAVATGLLLAAGSVQAQTVSVTPLAERAALDYAQAARFPEWTTLIEIGGIDPVLSDRVPARLSRLGPNGEDPRITVWADAMTALPGDSVTLYARLERSPAGPLAALAGAGPEPVAAESVAGTLVAEHSGELGTVQYRDDGLGVDSVAGDGIYTARFELPADRAPALGQAESVLVRTHALLPGNDQREATNGFVYSNPAARLTGNISDSVQDGDLVLSIELEVLAPGRVHLAGTLADAGGAPFVAAQHAERLEPGLRSVELRFYGLAFHDRAISGPATLASLAVTSTNGMPNAMHPVQSGLHVTRPIDLATLCATPFNDPLKLQAAERLGAKLSLR